MDNVLSSIDPDAAVVCGGSEAFFVCRLLGDNLNGIQTQQSPGNEAQEPELKQEEEANCTDVSGTVLPSGVMGFYNIIYNSVVMSFDPRGLL